jgi:hypothetical protein
MWFMNVWKVAGALHRPKVLTRGFKEAQWCLESGLVLVAFLDADIVISHTNVKLGEVTHTV